MARSPKRQKSGSASSGAPSPGAGSLGLGVALAALSALWALFQWTELLVARQGGEAFCGLGHSGACAQVWDSGLATAIQAWTGLPVAAWGLVWSGAALALPLLALVRRAGGGSPEPWWSATLLTAFAGALSVSGLAAGLFFAGAICTTCVITYVLVLAYGAVCVREAALPRGPELQRGAAAAVGAVAVGFVALLYPGLQTPAAPQAAGRQALEQLAGDASERDAGSPRDALLAELLDSLPPPLVQKLSDDLALYAEAEPALLSRPRNLIGPDSAPVRITEFADVLCGHCASLHATLQIMREQPPAGSFAVEPRYFPLDGSCNPQLERSAPTPVRCVAAKALICAEGRPGATAFATSLFENQRSLDVERVYELGSAVLSPDALAECVADPATDAKLQDDIAAAAELGITGTPMVLVNGRKATSFGPFLYALALTRGDVGHPLFRELPPPRPHDHPH